jgi:hypothetical protein
LSFAIQSSHDGKVMAAEGAQAAPFSGVFHKKPQLWHNIISNYQLGNGPGKHPEANLSLPVVEPV